MKAAVDAKRKANGDPELSVREFSKIYDDNLKKIKPRSIKDIYSNKQFIVDFSDEMKKTIKL